MVSKEDVLYYLAMRKSKKLCTKKLYYKIFKDKESDEYKKFINVYLNSKNILSEREQIVLDSIYGVNCEPMKLKEVGEIIGVTPERVRQILRKSEITLAITLSRIYLKEASEK